MSSCFEAVVLNDLIASVQHLEQQTLDKKHLNLEQILCLFHTVNDHLTTLNKYLPQINNLQHTRQLSSLPNISERLSLFKDRLWLLFDDYLNKSQKTKELISALKTLSENVVGEGLDAATQETQQLPPSLHDENLMMLGINLQDELSSKHKIIVEKLREHLTLIAEVSRRSDVDDAEVSQLIEKNRFLFQRRNQALRNWRDFFTKQKSHDTAFTTISKFPSTQHFVPFVVELCVTVIIPVITSLINLPVEIYTKLLQRFHQLISTVSGDNHAQELLTQIKTLLPSDDNLRQDSSYHAKSTTILIGQLSGLLFAYEHSRKTNVDLISDSTAVSICNHIFINLIVDLYNQQHENSLSITKTLLQRISDFLTKKMFTLKKDFVKNVSFLSVEPREWLDPLRQWTRSLLQNTSLAPTAATFLVHLAVACGSFQDLISLVELLLNFPSLSLSWNSSLLLSVSHPTHSKWLLSPSYNVSLDAAQCATTDGTFLYFKSTDGSLLKIGTGLNNTIRNLIYCSNPTFRGNYNLADDLIYHKHRLFYRCASMSKNTFQILNSETLKIENTITTETNSNLSEKVNFIKLATDGNRLFSLEYISHLTSQHSEWVVDIYSFDDTTLQLSHLRRLILQPPQVEGESNLKSIFLDSFEKYVPTQHVDYPTPNLVQFCSITSMPSYSNFSFEELRYIYYTSLMTNWNQSLYRFLSSSMVGVANDKLFVFRPQLSTVSLSSSVKTPLESSNQFYELRTFSLIDGRELFQRIVPSPLLFDFSTSAILPIESLQSLLLSLSQSTNDSIVKDETQQLDTRRWCIEILIRLNDIVKENSTQTCAESVCVFQDITPEIFSSLATLICHHITLLMNDLKPSQNPDEGKQQQEIKDNLVILWLSLQLLKNKMTQVKTQEQVQTEVLQRLKCSLLQIINGKVFTNSHLLQKSHIYSQLLNGIQLESCEVLTLGSQWFFPSVVERIRCAEELFTSILHKKNIRSLQNLTEYSSESLLWNFLIYQMESQFVLWNFFGSPQFNLLQQQSESQSPTSSSSSSSSNSNPTLKLLEDFLSHSIQMAKIETVNLFEQNFADMSPFEFISIRFLSHFYKITLAELEHEINNTTQFSPLCQLFQHFTLELFQEGIHILKHFVIPTMKSSKKFAGESPLLFLSAKKSNVQYTRISFSMKEKKSHSSPPSSLPSSPSNTISISEQQPNSQLQLILLANILKNSFVGKVIPGFVASLTSLCSIADHKVNVIHFSSAVLSTLVEFITLLDSFNSIISSSFKDLSLSPEMNHFSWLLDLEESSVLLAGCFASRLIVGDPIQPKEKQNRFWLKSKLFSGGLQQQLDHLQEVHKRFLDDLIQNEPNSIASKLLEWMFASSNRPLAQKGGPEVDMAERAVIAALLKHNNLVEEAHLCAQMLTKTEPKQTRSLHHIWDRAYKVRVWIMEQFQKTRTGTPSESPTSSRALQQWREIAMNVTKRMQFLLQLNPASTQPDPIRQITRSISLSILTALPRGSTTGSSPPSSPKSLKSARTLADVGITPPRALSSGDLKVVPATTSKTPLQEEKSTFVVSSSLSSSPNLPVKKTLPLESIFDCNHPLNRSRSKSGSSPHLSLTKIEEQNEEQSFHTTGSNSQFNLRSSSSLSLLTKKLSPDTPLTHPPKLKKMPRSKSECIIQVNLTKIQMKEEEVKKQRYQRIRHSFAMWKRIRAKLNANQDQDPNSPRQSVHEISDLVISFAKLDTEKGDKSTIDEFLSLLKLQRSRAQHRIQGLEVMAQLFELLSFTCIKNKLVGILKEALCGQPPLVATANSQIATQNVSTCKFISEGKPQRKKLYHYLDKIPTCGMELNSQLIKVFQKLYSQLITMLRSPETSIHVKLKLLNTFALRFRDFDHQFLSDTGLFSILNRFVSDPTRLLRNVSPHHSKTNELPKKDDNNNNKFITHNTLSVNERSQILSLKSVSSSPTSSSLSSSPTPSPPLSPSLPSSPSSPPLFFAPPFLSPSSSLSSKGVLESELETNDSQLLKHFHQSAWITMRILTISCMEEPENPRRSLVIDELQKHILELLFSHLERLIFKLNECVNIFREWQSQPQRTATTTTTTNSTTSLYNFSHLNSGSLSLYFSSLPQICNNVHSQCSQPKRSLSRHSSLSEERILETHLTFEDTTNSIFDILILLYTITNISPNVCLYIASLRFLKIMLPLLLIGTFPLQHITLQLFHKILPHIKPKAVSKLLVEVFKEYNCPEPLPTNIIDFFFQLIGSSLCPSLRLNMTSSHNLFSSFLNLKENETSPRPTDSLTTTNTTPTYSLENGKSVGVVSSATVSTSSLPITVPYSHSPMKKMSMKLNTSPSSETEKGFVFQHPSESGIQSTAFQSNTPTSTSFDFRFGTLPNSSEKFEATSSFSDQKESKLRTKSHKSKSKFKHKHKSQLSTEFSTFTTNTNFSHSQESTTVLPSSNKIQYTSQQLEKIKQLNRTNIHNRIVIARDGHTTHALADEIVILLRNLYSTLVWRKQIHDAVNRALNNLPSVVSALEEDNRTFQKNQQCQHSSSESEQIFVELPYITEVWSVLAALMTIGGESTRLRVGSKVSLFIKCKNPSHNKEEEYKTGVVVDLNHLTGKGQIVVSSLDRPLTVNLMKLNVISSKSVASFELLPELLSTLRIFFEQWDLESHSLTIDNTYQYIYSQLKTNVLRALSVLLTTSEPLQSHSMIADSDLFKPLLEVAVSCYTKDNPICFENIEHFHNRLKEELHNNRTQFYNWNALLKYSPFHSLPIYLPFCWSKKNQTPNFLTVIGADYTIAIYTDDERQQHLRKKIYSNLIVPSSIPTYYFEVTLTIPSLQSLSIGSIEVGICEVDVKTSTLEECDFRKTYTYRQDGSKFNNLTGISEPFGPTFGNGDVIGCGWNKSDDQCNNFIHIFFTHNGKFIGYAFRSVSNQCKGYYPFAMSKIPRSQLTVNFGQHKFVYSFTKHVNNLLLNQQHNDTTERNISTILHTTKSSLSSSPPSTDSRNDFHEEETPLQSEPVFVSSPSNDAKSKDFSSLSSPPLSHTLPDPFHYDVETNPSLSSNSGMDSKNTSHVWHTGSPPHNKSNNSLSLLKSSVHSTKKRSLSIPRISITKTRISLTTTKSAPVSSKMISSAGNNSQKESNVLNEERTSSSSQRYFSSSIPSVSISVLSSLKDYENRFSNLQKKRFKQNQDMKSISQRLGSVSLQNLSLGTVLYVLPHSTLSSAIVKETMNDPSWVSAMDRTIGESGIVVGIDNNLEYVLLQINHHTSTSKTQQLWWYPLRCLRRSSAIFHNEYIQIDSNFIELQQRVIELERAMCTWYAQNVLMLLFSQKALNTSIYQSLDPTLLFRFFENVFLCCYLDFERECEENQHLTTHDFISLIETQLKNSNNVQKLNRITEFFTLLIHEELLLKEDNRVTTSQNPSQIQFAEFLIRECLTNDCWSANFSSATNRTNVKCNFEMIAYILRLVYREGSSFLKCTFRKKIFTFFLNYLKKQPRVLDMTTKIKIVTLLIELLHRSLDTHNISKFESWNSSSSSSSSSSNSNCELNNEPPSMDDIDWLKDEIGDLYEHLIQNQQQSNNVTCDDSPKRIYLRALIELMLIVRTLGWDTTPPLNCIASVPLDLSLSSISLTSVQMIKDDLNVFDNIELLSMWLKTLLKESTIHESLATSAFVYLKELRVFEFLEGCETNGTISIPDAKNLHVILSANAPLNRIIFYVPNTIDNNNNNNNQKYKDTKHVITQEKPLVVEGNTVHYEFKPSLENTKSENTQQKKHFWRMIVSPVFPLHYRQNLLKNNISEYLALRQLTLFGRPLIVSSQTSPSKTASNIVQNETKENSSNNNKGNKEERNSSGNKTQRTHSKEKLMIQNTFKVSFNITLNTQSSSSELMDLLTQLVEFVNTRSENDTKYDFNPFSVTPSALHGTDTSLQYNPLTMRDSDKLMYPLLISALQIQIHAESCPISSSVSVGSFLLAVIQILNAAVERLISLLELDIGRTEFWRVGHHLSQLRSLLFHNLKRKFLSTEMSRFQISNQQTLVAESSLTETEESLIFSEELVNSSSQETNVADSTVLPTLTLNRFITHLFRPPTLESSGYDPNCVFLQAFAQLCDIDPVKLRNPVRPWNVRFVNEGSIDTGGLFRESLSLICHDLQSTRLPLFILCPNAQLANKAEGIGYNRNKWIPNPTCTDSKSLQMYEFVGKLLGVALWTNNTLPLDFPSIVWKRLVGLEPTIEDLNEIDSYCGQCLAYLTNDKEVSELTEANFSNVIFEFFTTTLSDGTVVDLKPNGANIPVTYSNRREYASLVANVRLRESAQQCEAIRRGLLAVFPIGGLLSLFTWQQFETLVTGAQDIDIELLKKHTRYENYREDDEVIKKFWKVLQSFSQQERRLFLRFVWGRETLPASHEWKQGEEMTISRLYSDDLLPQASTCFFSLKLPPYTNEETMRQKLLLAITNCSTIDTDFNALNE